jgi:hypothetical protein
MLCGLVDRFDVQGQLKDEPAGDQLNVPLVMKNVSYKAEKSRTKI